MTTLQLDPPVSQEELPERHFSGQTLTKVVSALIDLRQQVKQSHWNVTGTNFIGLHLLFDKLADELNESADTAAERQRALGFPVRGSIQQTARLSPLPDFPEDLTKSADVLAHLIMAYRTVAGEANAVIETITNDGDFGTADLLTECVRLLDQHLYFLKSHLV